VEITDHVGSLVRSDTFLHYWRG